MDFSMLDSHEGSTRSRGQEKKWEKHYVFLMKPFTYIVVHTLADFFGIHLRHTNFIAEAEDATSIEALIESVKGYVSTEDDDAQKDGVREEKSTPTSILRRAWSHSLKPNKKWMIHKALDGLGFTRACRGPYFDGTYIKQAGRGESVWVFGRPPFVFSRARHVLAFAHTYQRSYFGWHFYYKVGPHFFIVAGSDVGEA